MPKISHNNRVFIILLAMLGALPPFAIDTYLPAIPQIAKYFNVSPNEITITISTYFIGFSIGMLVWGLISDRFGRKKPLFIGITLYIIATLGCSATQSLDTFKVMRLLQGFSDSSGAIISMAIARDCFSGIKLKQTLSSIIMIMMSAPIIAPIIGSTIIYYTQDWKLLFHFLTIYGCILLLFLFCLDETLKHKNRSKKLISGINYYISHIKNYRFIILSLISGLSFAAIFSFIGSSGIIFISAFSTGYLSYCVLFGTNILGIIFANFLTKNKFLNVKTEKIVLFAMSLCFIGITFSLFVNEYVHNVILFTIGLTTITFSLALMMVNIQSQALNSVSEGFGAANSIASSIRFMFAGIANFLMSFYDSKNVVLHLSFQQLAIALIITLLLTIVFKANFSNHIKSA